MRKPFSLAKTDAELLDLVDRFGELKRQIDAFQPVHEEFEDLKSQIKARYDSEDATGSFVLEGRQYDVQIGARELIRTIRSMPAVAKAVGGVKGLYDLVSIPITKLEEKLGKEAAAGLITESRTGARRVRAVAKAPAVIQVVA